MLLLHVPQHILFLSKSDCTLVTFESDLGSDLFLWQFLLWFFVLHILQLIIVSAEFGELHGFLHIFYSTTTVSPVQLLYPVFFLDTRTILL